MFLLMKPKVLIVNVILQMYNAVNQPHKKMHIEGEFCKVKVNV